MRDRAIAMVQENGTMLLRRPFSDGLVGKNVVTTTLLRPCPSHEAAGTFITRSLRDGVVRLNCYRRLRHSPAFVAAALSRDEMFAHGWCDILVHSAGDCAAGDGDLFGWWLVEQIRLRARAEAELISTRRLPTNLNETLEQLAMHDGLTEPANRRQFDTNSITNSAVSYVTRAPSRARPVANWLPGGTRTPVAAVADQLYRESARTLV